MSKTKGSKSMLKQAYQKHGTVFIVTGLSAILLMVLYFLQPVLTQKPAAELAAQNHTPVEIIAWSKKAVQRTMTFDATNADNKLQKARAYFTTQGWDGFYEALQESGIVETAKNRKLHIALTVLQDPVIKNAYAKDGVYTWYLEMPVIINMDDGSTANLVTPLRAKLMLQIARSSEAQNADGIGIVQWVTISEH